MIRKTIKSLKSNFKRLVMRNSEPRTTNIELQRGFTLIEIIIVIVILSIVSGITIKFLIDSLKIYTMTVNQKTLFDEGKLALERMCRDIRDARTITTPAAGGSGNTIVFQRTNATGSGQDLVDETISYRLNGSNLQREKASYSLPYPILASNVSTFTVIRGTIDNHEITLSLALSLGTGENVTLQTKVYPKNLDKDATNTYKNFFQNWREEPSS
jgi:prepilin-type N-terminal cleavage/methylation domain-containing protein